MRREQVPSRGLGAHSSTAPRDVQRERSPGKRSLTEGLAAAGHPDATAEAARDVGLPGRAPLNAAHAGADAGQASAGGDPRPTLLFGVQRAAMPGVPAEDPAHVHAAAGRGTATPATTLPFAGQIQRLFGRHDISKIQAHTGADAAASAGAMGAKAYATGDHVVLGEGADLHTVAHEAAHVVQQRGGAPSDGDRGAAGASYERHADDVAARVVQGESAEAVLDRVSPSLGALAVTDGNSERSESTPPGRAGAPPGTRVVQRALRANAYNVPAPALVHACVKEATRLIHAAHEAMSKMESAKPFEHLFKEPKAESLLKDLAAMVAVADFISTQGEVVPGESPETPRETTGYRCVDSREPLAERAGASAAGEGNTGLVTFYPGFVHKDMNEATWTTIHELSHIAPGLTTKDHGYRFERIFPMLNQMPEQKTINADTYASLVFELTGTKRGLDLQTQFSEREDEFLKTEPTLEQFTRLKMALANKAVDEACNGLRRVVAYLESCRQEESWDEDYVEHGWFTSLAEDLKGLGVPKGEGPSEEQLAIVQRARDDLQCFQAAFSNPFRFCQVPAEEQDEPFLYGESAETLITTALLKEDEPVLFILEVMLGKWVDGEERVSELNDVAMTFAIENDWPI